MEILADIVEPLEDNEGDEQETEEEPHETFTRVLSICEEILRYTEMGVSHPGIGTGLLQNYIIPSLRHADCVVREKALACLGLYCLLDMKEAAKYLLLFVKVVGSAEPDAVQLVAVRTLFDFLTLFGPETLIKQEKEWPEEFQVWNEEDDEEDDDINDTRSFTIVTLVRCLTQTKNPLIRSTAVEGFAKLLLNNFISDFQIVSVLITLYFHPATDRDQQLTQCLGVFFPAYCLNSPKHTDTLKEAFLPTLERILGSNQYSPLRKVNIEKVVQFMIMHIDMSNTKLPSKSLPGHDELAVGVARLVLNNLSSNKDMSKSLCKVLSSMRIAGTDPDVSSRLSAIVVRLLDKISEKPLLKILNSIQNTLHKNGKKRRSKSPPKRKSPPRKRRRTESPDSRATTRKRRRTNSLRGKTSPNKKARTEDLEENPDTSPDQIDLVQSEREEEEEEERGYSGDEFPNSEEETTEVHEPSKSKRVVISFSGFTMSDNVYNYTYLHSLVKDAKKLGAELVLGNVIDSSITHIVSPPNQRTMKTIVGSITNRWIVVPEWLTKSAKAEKFLREELYGGKTTGKPFKDKKIFISKKFVDENPNKQFNHDILKSLICNAGKGKLVKSDKEADFVLCSKNDPRVSSTDHNISYLTWKGFFEFLQPTVNIL
uniref:BRCT domain-containing protein n=1 Tax=Vannella robusta TaxID=1487602 RepID=A0A7S4MGF0_9EUKA